jgi:hypothetical protein
MSGRLVLSILGVINMNKQDVAMLFEKLKRDNGLVLDGSLGSLMRELNGIISPEIMKRIIGIFDKVSKKIASEHDTYKAMLIDAMSTVEPIPVKVDKPILKDSWGSEVNDLYEVELPDWKDEANFKIAQWNDMIPSLQDNKSVKWCKEKSTGEAFTQWMPIFCNFTKSPGFSIKYSRNPFIKNNPASLLGRGLPDTDHDKIDYVQYFCAIKIRNQRLPKAMMPDTSHITDKMKNENFWYDVLANYDKVELVNTNVEKGRGLGEKNATFDIRLDAGNNPLIYMMFKSCQYVAEFRDRPRGL